VRAYAEGVRVLIGCSIGGAGHLLPLVSVARALRSIGHEPLLLVAPSVADRVAGTELEFVVGDQPAREVVDRIWQRVKARPAADVEYLIDRELFATLATDAMLSRAEILYDEFEPEMIVREPCEYATAIVAHRAGIPQVQIAISQSALEHRVLTHVADVLEGRARGVVDRILKAPYLTSFPESLDPSPWSDTRRFRDDSSAPRPLPDWWPDQPGTPLVYVTFGTVLGHQSEAVEAYRAAIDAVGGLPVRVLLTVGSTPDIEALGPIPSNTHVERWVPQQDVFASAQLVVCHGGSGTTFGALRDGLPLLICPMFADQLSNAELIEAAGAGVRLNNRQAGDNGFRPLQPDDALGLRELIASMLSETSYAGIAEQLAREMAQAPTLDKIFADLTATRG
jgi:UDP:flavonoid glycosyltransferase YjiC (YdhE family)